MFNESKKKWFEDSEYTNEQYFKNASRSIERKKGRGVLSIAQIIDLMNKHVGLINEVRLSDNLSRKLIHYGRKGDTIDRDFTFYTYAREYLDNNKLTNTLFINYTGHSGPVAAALSEQNIPLFWQMDLSQDNIAEDRVLGQIQDYSTQISNNNGTNNSNMGLMLECPHGFENTLIHNDLPTSSDLLAKGIENVVIFTEDPYQEISTATSELIPGIQAYVEELKKAGIIIKYVGIDCRNKSQSSDFKYPYKEKIENFDIYSTNFQRITTTTITPEEAAIIALKGTSTDKANEANSKEQLESNTEIIKEGETKDD